VSPNDATDGDSGPNGRQNFPVLASALIHADGVLVTGSLGGTSPLGLYSIDVFMGTACDPSGHGEGQTFVGTTSEIGAGGAFGEILVESPPPGALYVTAIATGPDGTSEFSQCTQIVEDLGPRLITSAPSGATRLDVDPTGLVGRVVTVGDGPTADHNFGLASGSLVLAKKLRFAHAAGEPVVATDDTLFVSVDKAVITRSSRLPDLGIFFGTLRPVAGRSIACGDDVALTLDGGRVAQRIPGTRFARQSGNRCVFVAKTDNGIGRLELDLAKGTWNAELVRRDLERLSNPVDVGLTIGDDAGSESIRFRTTNALWTYAR
jgi:hypothetical protein